MTGGTQEIAVGARVEARDGAAGRLTNVIVDPLRRRASHVVVEGSGLEARSVLVPIERVARAERDAVRLDCSLEELRQMPEFYETRYVPASDPAAAPVLAQMQTEMTMAFSTGYSTYYQPYVMPLMGPNDTVPVSDAQVPPGELSFYRGSRVESSDGHDVGTVEVFIFGPRDHTITHFSLRMGHLVRAREVALPVSTVASADSDVVRLKLTREEVERLPALPARRGVEWTSQSPGTLELVAFVFDTVQGAAGALELTKGEVAARRLPAVDAAWLTKSPDGKVESHEEHDISAGRGALVGAVVGGLLTLVAGPLGPLAGVVAGGAVGGLGAGLVDRGVPNGYLRDLGRELRPGTSALVVLVHPASVDALLAALSPLGGTVLRQLLTDEMVRRLTAPPGGGPAQPPGPSGPSGPAGGVGAGSRP